VYQQPPTAGARNEPQAVWSLVLGILSLVCCGFIAGIAAILVGGSAQKSIAASGGTLGGEGMAKAGVIMGWISIGLSIIGIVVWVILLVTGNATVHVNTTTN
jgi:hypothetical protein